MSSKRQRNSNRSNAKELKDRFGKKTVCLNCGRPGSHYVAPCFGDSGFYACDAINRLELK